MDVGHQEDQARIRALELPWSREGAGDGVTDGQAHMRKPPHHPSLRCRGSSLADTSRLGGDAAHSSGTEAPSCGTLPDLACVFLDLAACLCPLSSP